MVGSFDAEGKLMHVVKYLNHDDFGVLAYSHRKVGQDAERRGKRHAAPPCSNTTRADDKAPADFGSACRLASTRGLAVEQ